MATCVVWDHEWQIRALPPRPTQEYEDSNPRTPTIETICGYYFYSILKNQQ